MLLYLELLNKYFKNIKKKAKQFFSVTKIRCILKKYEEFILGALG